MKKCVMLACAVMILTTSIFGQDEEEEEKGFKLENLFTGGSVSLAFYNNTFLIGGNPVFGYSIASWIDAGLVVNYNYSSYRDVSYYGSNDKLRQHVYGGGVFTKIYPVRFLFVQAQVEHNFIKQKYIASSGTFDETMKVEASSFLVGAGYTTSRNPGSGLPFFYLAVMFDLGRETYSPYKDNFGRTIPIVRGGIQVPLFQKRNSRRLRDN
jgi:hypothetical protein